MIGLGPEGCNAPELAVCVPESDIQLWVGHADSKVIALYRHIRDEIAKENIRKIDFGAA